MRIAIAPSQPSCLSATTRRILCACVHGNHFISAAPFAVKVNGELQRTEEAQQAVLKAVAQGSRSDVDRLDQITNHDAVYLLAVVSELPWENKTQLETWLRRVLAALAPSDRVVPKKVRKKIENLVDPRSPARVAVSGGEARGRKLFIKMRKRKPQGPLQKGKDQLNQTPASACPSNTTPRSTECAKRNRTTPMARSVGDLKCLRPPVASCRSVKVLTLPPPQASESWRPKEGKVFASASLERRQPGRRGLRTGGRGCRRVPCAGQAEASCVGYAAAACRHSGEESPGAAALPS